MRPAERKRLQVMQLQVTCLAAAFATLIEVAAAPLIPVEHFAIHRGGHVSGAPARSFTPLLRLEILLLRRLIYRLHRSHCRWFHGLHRLHCTWSRRSWAFGHRELLLLEAFYQ
jgi:hypothetical protein